MRTLFLFACCLFSIFANGQYSSTIKVKQYAGLQKSISENRSYVSILNSTQTSENLPGLSLKTEQPKLNYKPHQAGITSTMIVSPLLIGEKNYSTQPKNTSVNIKKRTLISGALFIPTFATGYWLSKSQKPPHTLLLTIHKLTSVSNIVMLDATVWQLRKEQKLHWSTITSTITMNMCFVGTIATGGMLSIDKKWPTAINEFHQVLPWATIISSGVLMYILNKSYSD